MSGDEFLRALDDLQKAAVAESVPHIVPQRTKDDALAAHEARKNITAGDMIEEAADAIQAAAKDQAEQLRVPPSRPVVIPTGPLTETDKKVIRSRYQIARTGKVRIERGWVRRVAEEYHVDPSKIYNIIYTDPDYEGVPRNS